MSSKLGVEVSDSDLEARLQRIEAELANRVVTNLEGQETAILRSSLSAVPRPANVRFSNNIVGAISVFWDALKSKDVRYYEVQVSNNFGFVENESQNLKVFTYKVPDNRFVFPEAFDPELNWFVRVRTVTTNQRKSPWTTTLSTELGRAVKTSTAQDILPGSYNGIVSGSATFTSQLNSSFGYNPTTDNDIYGITDIVWEKGVVLPFSIVEFLFAVGWYNPTDSIATPTAIPPALTLELWRVHDLESFETNPVKDQNYKVINTASFNFASTIGFSFTNDLELAKLEVLAQQIITGFGTPDEIAVNAPFIKPGQTIGYRLYVKVDAQDSKNFIFFRPTKVTLEMVELRS